MEKGILKPTSPKEYSKAENGCIKKKTGKKTLMIYILLGLWFCFKKKQSEFQHNTVKVMEEVPGT